MSEKNNANFNILECNQLYTNISMDKITELQLSLNDKILDNESSHFVVTVATDANRNITLPTPIIGKKFRIYWSVDDNIVAGGANNFNLNLQVPVTATLSGKYMEYIFIGAPGLDQSILQIIYRPVNIVNPAAQYNLNISGLVPAGFAAPLWTHPIDIKAGSYLDFICYSRNIWTISGKIIVW